MIDLPDKLLRNQLYSYLKRGKILRTQLSFGNKTIFKRLILLNVDFQGEDIFYMLTTSQVEFYNKYGIYDPIKGNYIYIAAGKTVFNPQKDMVIDCRRIDIIEKEKLFKNYKYKKLKVLGDLPSDILRQIDTIVFDSVLIPQKIKEKVLP